VYIFSQANAIHYGGEAQVDWKMNNYLQINANVEYVRTHNYVTGLPLPFIPPLAQVTEVEFKTPLNNVKWVKNLSIKWAQAFYAPQNRVDRNEKTTPGYSLSHLYSSVNIGKSNHFQLLFQINNVFDQVYMNHLSRWRYLNLPEAGRNFNIIFKAGF
jgi:iron complex outermembrane receptor protein